MIAILTLGGCASAGPATREASAGARPTVREENPISLETALDSTRASIELAMSQSLAGATRLALDSVEAALGTAKDLASIAGALEAKSWALLFAGSSEAAREALRQASAVGAPAGPGRAVLEFRLAAFDGMEAARRSAARALERADLGQRAATAIAVMLGEKDIRDISLDSPEAATEYATYLAGYSLAPEPPTAPALAAASAPPAAAEGPVVVVASPESVGADDATIAVARLACRDALSRRGDLRLVDADSRRTALDELELSLSGATAGEKDMAVGRLFSADFVAAGSVVKTDSGWLVAYSLSSSQDGSIVASGFSMAPDHAGIAAAAARFASSLDGLAAAAGTP